MFLSCGFCLCWNIKFPTENYSQYIRVQDKFFFLKLVERGNSTKIQWNCRKNWSDVFVLVFKDSQFLNEFLRLKEWNTFCWFMIFFHFFFAVNQPEKNSFPICLTIKHKNDLGVKVAEKFVGNCTIPIEMFAIWLIKKSSTIPHNLPSCNFA